ncbi:T9SS type B sorting domain-containing protein [Winogradskyella sp.]|uniref:T9SS type B sorting domain-containing protein n=1 Tax=Winogradskyella sp. TaxID=1883156 RepID=UPI0037039639
MPIVTDVNISGGSDNAILEAVYIQIATGYTLGSDELLLTGTHPNILSSWTIGEGLLTLTGPATHTEFENAINAVRFQTSAMNFTQDKFISINLGVANYLPATGHYYSYVSDIGISWTEALNAASEQTYFGLQGYLATITTPEEVQLTGEQAQGTGWIGASDQTSEGTWRWESGPEAGQIFWNGAVNGSSPDGMFSFWNSGEPNNLGDEDYAHITDPEIGILGSWNDLANTGSSDSSSPYHPQGYVVEFGGMDGDPNINVSASTIIVMPQTSVEKNSLCEEGLAQINISTNTDTVFWYETETSTNAFHSGLYYENYIYTTTTYYIAPIFNGCEDGERIPVTVNVYEPPIANDITIMQCDDEEIDGISSFNLSNYSDDIVRNELGQVIPIWDVTFFEDEALTQQIDGENYNNFENYQIIYAKVSSSFTGCFSSSEVTLQVNSYNSQMAILEVCDDFIEDGYAFFDLTQANSQILQNAPTNATIGYYVKYNEALLQINEVTEDYFNEEAFNQIVYARVDIDDTCYAIYEVHLIVKELPDLIGYEEVYYCVNTFPEPMTLSGGVLNDIPNNYAYNWSTGETTMDIAVNTTGTYEVFVTRPSGCTNRRTVVVKPSSTAIIESVEVTDVSENNRIAVLVSGEGNYSYALNDENGPYQESNIFDEVSSGIHTLYVKDTKGDCGSINKQISVLGFPKFFTPNGDNVNDTWKVKGYSSLFPVSATVKIFNRFGKIITILTETNPVWDGRFNGELLPTDDYWFVAKLNDGRTYSGHFTLKR